MVAGNEGLDLRIHHGAPAAAAEDAVMPRALDLQVVAFAARHALAQCVGGLGLAGAGDVVQFAFHRHLRRGGDVLRAHALQLAVGRAHVPGAVHQAEVLEHGLDGFQVVIGVHVEHGVVLVVELAVRVGAGLIALDQVLEVVVVAAGVAVRVHGDEAGVLQEARVHAAAGTGVVGRHAVDDVVLEPLVAALHGQVVHGGGRLARVDGAAHHGHGDGGLLAAAGHQRHGGQRGHRGLAHADDVAVAVLALHVADELLHVVDVVVQVELALGQRHHAGVLPVGDVDLVAFQHGAHGVAQQRGVMARQRRHDQHRRLHLQLFQRRRIVREALEAQQLAEGLVDLHALVDGHLDAIHVDLADVELGFLVILAQAVEQGIGGRYALRHGQLAQQGVAVAVGLGGGIGHVGKRLKQRTLRFVDLIKHWFDISRKAVAAQYSAAPCSRAGKRL